MLWESPAGHAGLGFLQIRNSAPGALARAYSQNHVLGWFDDHPITAGPTFRPKGPGSAKKSVEMERCSSSSQGLGGSGGGAGTDGCPSSADTRASMLPNGLRCEKVFHVTRGLSSSGNTIAADGCPNSADTRASMLPSGL